MVAQPDAQGSTPRRRRPGPTCEQWGKSLPGCRSDRRRNPVRWTRIHRAPSRHLLDLACCGLVLLWLLKGTDAPVQAAELAALFALLGFDPRK